MRSDVMVLVRKARADWLRAQCEIAYVRVLMAAQRYADALRREDKYRPDQPRVPAGHPDGGQWTDAGGNGEASIDLAQARGRGGNVRVGGYSFEATPAQILRLSNATNAAEAAVLRVRDIDPSWRPRPGLYESAEGAISHQIGIEAEANARFNELRRDAIPGTSHDWGVNRLRKELYALGYRYAEPTDAEGSLYRRQNTLEEVRIMRRPAKRYRDDPEQKFWNEYYYRYRSGPDQSWRNHTTILDRSRDTKALEVAYDLSF